MEALLLIKANDAVQQLVDSSLVCTVQGMRKGSSGMIILQGIHLFPASASPLLQRAQSEVHSVNFSKGNFTVKRERLLLILRSLKTAYDPFIYWLNRVKIVQMAFGSVNRLLQTSGSLLMNEQTSSLI